MPVSFSDLQLAFEFVSGGGTGENEAYLDQYISIPHKRELDLGKPIDLARLPVEIGFILAHATATHEFEREL